MKAHVIVFDRPYSDEKMAEGRAIQWAVVNGACNRCQHLAQCGKDKNFKFPENAPCMLKKLELTKGGAKE